MKFCRFSPHTLHLERKVEVFPAGSEAGSARIHFILKRKLHITKSLDQLKVCCRFSPHTLHLGKKVEVFPAEGGEVLQVQRYDCRGKEKKNPIDPGKALGSADLSLSKMA